MIFRPIVNRDLKTNKHNWLVVLEHEFHFSIIYIYIYMG